jgi:putative tricarboxylic transport membrane protein
MRRGEFITAGVLAVLSIYFMWKSTELPIGYLKGQGPGGGAWTFWLSAIMLICTILILINAKRGTTPPSQSTEPVLDPEGRKMLIQVFGGIFLMVALTDIISIYFAMALFLFYYVWFLGRHKLLLALAISIGVPIFFFIFFEKFMSLSLPKGEDYLTGWFYNWAYALIYGS